MAGIPLPPQKTAVKLASLAVHADEFLETGHLADSAAIRSLLEDPDVKVYLDELSVMALLPVKRSG